MPRIRFVTPDTRRLDIGDGDWIEVKKRLTNGELRKAQASAIKTVQGFGADAKYTPDSDVLGKAEVLAYLLDWSLLGIDGKKVRIDKEDAKRSAIDNLDPEDFDIISKAVAKHVEEMEAERAEAKKTQSGSDGSRAISASPSDATGPMNTSLS